MRELAQVSSRTTLRRVLVVAMALAALSTAGEPLAAGRLLIGTSKSRDPELGKAVILLIHSDAQGAIGLILNQPNGVPLSQLFPPAKGGGVAYTGGPVPLGTNALLRSQRKLKSAANLFGDVYLIADKVSMEAAVNAGAPSSVFRVYVGCTGWSAAQLRDELAAGLWRIAPADAAMVFDPHPETLWERLGKRSSPHGRAELPETHRISGA